MSNNILNFKKLDPRAVTPTRNNPEDAGIDLYALEDCVIPSLFNTLYVYITYNLKYLCYLSKIDCSEDIECKTILATKIKTGIAFEIPVGYFGKIEDRSGLGSKLLKTFGGVIDSGYRGDVSVCLANFSFHDYHVKAGDKIAQIVIEKCELPIPVEVDVLSDTTRGEKGFGSSGS